MSSVGEVTRFLHKLKDGDRDAARPLWEQYYHRLVATARDRLRGNRLAVADGDDVALSAFDSFCRRAEEGRFPRLNDRKDLWTLLVMIAERKAYDLIQHEKRQRRDYRRRGPLDAAGAEQVLGGEMDPAIAAQMADEFKRLLALLPDEQLRTIASLKLQAYTNQEIAQRIVCGVSSIERKLNIIRKHWQCELSPES